jgi:hypothetical protein
VSMRSCYVDRRAQIMISRVCASRRTEQGRVWLIAAGPRCGTRSSLVHATEELAKTRREGA